MKMECLVALKIVSKKSGVKVIMLQLYNRTHTRGIASTFEGGSNSSAESPKAGVCVHTPVAEQFSMLL